MKKILILALLIYPFLLNAQEAKPQIPAQNPFTVIKPLPYSQLIGFKVGGAYYVYTSLSEATSSIFFESVMNNFIGLEIELGAYNIPVTNYNVSGVDISGNGLRKYIELSGGFKFYLFGAGLYLGLSYNDFISGYLITESMGYRYYNTMSDQERDFFSLQLGPEINAQISSDLFSKVGVRFIYGFVPDSLNYTVAIRFFISFAYGL
ncbi:MAG: hypothetical protein N2258_00975 [Brevinematales bacterium]|nr:hypothetical protein [Brevinematales bacterium]